MKKKILSLALASVMLLSLTACGGGNTSSSTPNMTETQETALDRAKGYISSSPFSHDGLIDQLMYEKFSKEDATFAADNCGADWNEQAALKAQSYLDLMSFSRSQLIDQLEFEGFTTEQAEYGATAVGY